MSKSDEWEIVAGGSEVLRVTALDDEGNAVEDDNPFTIRSVNTPLKINANSTTAAGITFAGSANTNIYRVGGVVNPELNLPEDFNTLKAEVEALKAEIEPLRSLVGEMWGMIVDLTAIVDTKADSRKGRGQTQPRRPGLSKPAMIKELVAISKGKSSA